MYNVVTSLASSFLIGSTSFLQVIRTCIKAWMRSNFGQIPPLTTELPALERLKNQCLHFFSVAIDPNLLKLSGKEAIHNILDELEFQPDLTTNNELAALVYLKYTLYTYMYWGKCCLNFFSIVFLLAGGLRPDTTILIGMQDTRTCIKT